MTTYVIGGCARNCGQWLPGVFQNINTISSKYNVIAVLISHDDSEDDTLSILEFYQQTHPVRILRGLQNEGACREERIASARNRIMDCIKAEYSTVDYMIMMDMDDVCAGQMDISVLNNAIEHEAEWDAVSFNRIPYYDLWALSVGDWEFSLWHHKHPYGLIEYLRKDLATLLNSADQWITVGSAFCGFAVYKWSVFQKYRYDHRIDYSLFDTAKISRIVNLYKAPLMIRDFHDCEHRSFHLRAIKDGARIILYKNILFPAD